MTLNRGSGLGRKVLVLTLALVTGGSLNAYAAEHMCGSVSVDVVSAPVPGGSVNDRCGTAWATCGTLRLTVLNEPVVGVKQFVAERQENGKYGPMVQTNDCKTTFGDCAWQGPPAIDRNGDATTITQTLNNWTRKDNAGSWKRATLYAYCD